MLLSRRPSDGNLNGRDEREEGGLTAINRTSLADQEREVVVRNSKPLGMIPGERRKPRRKGKGKRGKGRGF